MKLCIPVEADRGLESRVSLHFGSARAYVVVETQTGALTTIPNEHAHHEHAHHEHAHHEHGACTPVDALRRAQVAGAVVGGIGAGALAQLNAADIQVYAAAHETVAEVVAAWSAGTLRPVDTRGTCRGGCHG